MPENFIVLSTARAGSTFFLQLLRKHPQIKVASELLAPSECKRKDGSIVPRNDKESALAVVRNAFSDMDGKYSGFKIFPEHLEEWAIPIDELCDYLSIEFAIILWRKDLLDQFVSWELANKTGVWYSEATPTAPTPVEVSDPKLQAFGRQLLGQWRKVAAAWPINVRPLFVCYEDLVTNIPGEMSRILSELGIVSNGIDFLTPTHAQKQNPFPLSEKIKNFTEVQKFVLPQSCEVPEIIMAGIQANSGLLEHHRRLLPDYEPRPAGGKWNYRVAEPFIPKIAKLNVADAVNSTSISSAGRWPREMSAIVKQVFGVPVVQPCNNGFTGLVLSLQAAGVGGGDEVLVPTFTMIAVANAVSFVGAKPIFLDNSACNRCNPGLAGIRQSINERTKALILTHTYGVPVSDMDEIVKLCAEASVTLIEDISQCVGIRDDSNRLLGTYGEFACASLYVNKMVSAGDGGFVIARDARLGKRLASLANHGFTKCFHFLHKEKAINAKICGLAAAMATGGFASLNLILQQRSTLASAYRKFLQPTPIQLMPACGLNDTPWIFGGLCQSKDEKRLLRKHLAANGIETRDFFLPLHAQPAYAEKHTSMPIAETLGSTGFYLPSHSNLTEADIAWICGHVLRFFGIQDYSHCGRFVLEASGIAQCPSADNGNTSGVIVNPLNLRVETRYYDSAGEIQLVKIRGDPFVLVVNLRYQLRQFLYCPRWDTAALLLEDINKLLHAGDWYRQISAAAGVVLSLQTWQQYVEWFMANCEFALHPAWLQMPFTDRDVFAAAEAIPTTSTPELLSLLAWLVKAYGCKRILEVGSWLGHAAVLMAAAATKTHNADLAGDKPQVFAVDGFKWQSWMEDMIPLGFSAETKTGRSFLGLFRELTIHVADVVFPIPWSLDCNDLRELLRGKAVAPFDLVFLDFSQFSDELEIVWQQIEEYLNPGKSIIVLTCLHEQTLPFILRHANHLQLLAVTRANSPALRYLGDVTQPGIGANAEEECGSSLSTFLPQILASCKFSFAEAPEDWSHHHNSAFFHDHPDTGGQAGRQRLAGAVPAGC